VTPGEGVRGEPPRIVVAGGGFGGLYAAVYLARSELGRGGARITLVDRKNYFTFTPLIAEVAGGTLPPDHVTYPYRVLGRRYGFEFVREEIRSVEPERRILRTEGREVEYDYLVLAVGASPRFFGNETLRTRSLPLTTVEEATEIRDRVIDAVERAVVTEDPEERRVLTTFVIAGGGPAGVELANEIHRLLRETLPPFYPEMPQGRVILAEGSGRILRGWDDELARKGLNRMRERGIEARLETRVLDATEDRVTLGTEDGEEEIPARTLVWTAGVSPPDWIARLPFPTERGALRVEPTLQVEGRERIFAVGDVSHLIDPRTERPYPGVAPIAISQGIRAAGNIENLHRDRPLAPYHAHHAGKIVSLGSGEAFVDLLGFQVTGPAAWWLYRLTYLLKLVGLKNKLRVLVTLVLNRFFEPDISSRGGDGSVASSREVGERGKVRLQEGGD